MLNLQIESRLMEADPQRWFGEVWAGLRSHQIDPWRDFGGVRDIFEHFVKHGHEALTEIRLSRRNESRTGVLLEAGDAINTAAFSNIIGQISYSTVLDTFESAEFIARNLVNVVPAETQQQEVIPGVSKLSDLAEEIGEGEEYPAIGLSEERVIVPRKVKHGFRVLVTEEIIDEDKTGLVQQMVNDGGTVMAINWEKEVLDTVLGITTSYRRNDGPAQATYADTHTEGDFDNLAATNALVDWTDIETAELLFDDITDPNTGEPVLIGGEMQIVVPTALSKTLARILEATGIEQGAISATVPRTLSPNPLNSQTASRLRRYSGFSSQYVKNRTSSTTTWFIGNFRQAFQYREKWPIQSFSLDRNSQRGFDRDVVTQIKTRRKGAPAVVEPRKVVKCTA